MVTVHRTERAAGTFRITFRIGETEYAVFPLQPDPEVASKAYRLKKVGGDGAVYDVSQDRFGPQCECLGFLRWNRPCKHIRTLQAAGMLAPVHSPE